MWLLPCFYTFSKVFFINYKPQRIPKSYKTHRKHLIDALALTQNKYPIFAETNIGYPSKRIPGIRLR